MSVDLAQHAAAGQRDDGYDQYRAISTLAVVSGALGVLSIVAILDWSLGIIPLAGIVCGLLALRRIRANCRELSGRRLALLGLAASILFLVGGWSRLSYVYLTEVPDGYQRISYAQLRLDRGDHRQAIPDSALQLDGKRVFVKGYMFPGQHRAGIKQFVLVRDNGDCCFGGPSPPLSDMILVKLAEPLEAEYSTRIRRLGGTFRIDPATSGDVKSGILYQLEADYFK